MDFGATPFYNSSGGEAAGSQPQNAAQGAGNRQPLERKEQH